ncbi:nucleotidyl transferase AbiEii/AbiGii toxin family protein [Nocardia lijiangensis]|uniref:nucleotidyl transferase AbiEii/AbiGii toxin family protein n=1 Tax=Nocardia lijiangensis TaxID=299618 RepID=UPI0008312BAB|nr:nucleotidyl transferase AbiEii/AbiGii toxin family protein [Nocardia lijiangensis]
MTGWLANPLCDWTTDETWLASRRAAIDHVLAAVADSEWSHCFALRGSVLMPTWFGDRAREPGELDLVVLSERLPIGEVNIDELLADVVRRATARSHAPGSAVWIDTKVIDAETTGYWSHDMLESGWMLGKWGSRFLLSWQGNGHVGTVQVDFSTEELICDAPQPTEISLLGRPGASVPLQAFSRQMSLAWKVLRIAADAHGNRGPLAKDLYDAVLLAEQCTLPRELLERIVAEVWLDQVYDSYVDYKAADARHELDYPTLDFMIGAANDVDWTAFARACPHLSEAHDEYVWRFAIALAPVVDDADTLYPRILDHCARELATVRDALSAGGMRSAERALADSGCSAVVQLVVVRELLGRDRSLPEAAAHLAAMRPVGTTNFDDLQRIAAALARHAP